MRFLCIKIPSPASLSVSQSERLSGHANAGECRAGGLAVFAAIAGVFFAVAVAAGTPPLLMVALFAYFSDLCDCTTNYSSGPVCIYCGLGYVPAKTWFRIGFLVSIFHLTIWLSLGLGWWKLLGRW